MRRWIAVLLFLVAAGLVQAQDAQPTPTPSDEPTISPIGFDQIVQDTITDKAVYDWWQISLQADDVIVVEMQAFDGLSPLVGILSPTQELVSRSDEARPPEPNALAVVQYRATANGVFTVVATREGNQDGVTIGGYQLRVRKINAIPDRQNDLPPVEFRCNKLVGTNVLMLSFEDEIPDSFTPEQGYRERYRLSIYGEDAFAPLILADSDLVKTGRLDCDNDASAVIGNTYTRPGEPMVTLDEALQAHAAQVTLQNTSLQDQFGQIRFTLGSLNAAPGRYFVELEGLALEQPGDEDTLTLRPGPLAAQMPLTVYVVGENPGRLDVSLMAYGSDNAMIAQCDDAGRGDCSDVPSFEGAGATTTGESEMPLVVGDRFDAGVRLPVDSKWPVSIDINAGDTGTYGRYTIFIMGELPAPK